MVLSNVVYTGTIDGWRDLAIQEARDKNIEIESFQSIENSLFWWFGSFKQTHKTEHIYFELMFRGDKQKWVVFGSVFSVDPSMGRAHPMPFVLEPSFIDNNETQRLAFNFLGSGHWLKYLCNIDIVTDSLDKLFRLREINISVFIGPILDTKNKKNEVIGKIIEKFSDDDSKQPAFMNIPCPDCYGRGFSKSFAIPKKDYESGATGYALYSYNTLCATVACTKCGGIGVQYEDWYLKEQPELALYKGHVVPFHLGSGVVRVERSPSTGGFN